MCLRVRIFDDSRVDIFDDSRVGIFDDFRVGIFDDYRVGIFDDSRVGIFDDYRVGIFDDYRVGIFDDSRVGIFDDSRVGIFDDYRVDIFDDYRVASGALRPGPFDFELATRSWGHRRWLARGQFKTNGAGVEFDLAAGPQKDAEDRHPHIRPQSQVGFCIGGASMMPSGSVS